MKKFISKNGVIFQLQSRPVLERRGAIGVVLLPASEMLMSKAQAQEMTKQKDDECGGKLTKG